MKIICLARSLTVGGAERQIAGLSVMLSEKGHNVEVVTYHPQDFYAAYLDSHNVPHKCILKRSERQLQRDLGTYIRQQSPDIVIAFLAGPCIKACKIHRKWPHFALVVSERNVNQHFLPHDSYRFHLFRQADKVIANSHAQEDFVRRHAPYLGDKLGAIVNFVDTDRFHPEEKRRWGAVKVICTTARVDKRKNLHGYIRAAGILKSRGYGFDIRWYGLVKKDSYYLKCMKLIDTLGLGSCFHILEASSDVERIYAESDIFCLPSFYEGTPNSMCEAISSGLPIACSRVSDNAVYVRSGINGETFDPTCSVQIADALGKLLDLSAGQAAHYGAHSRQTALQLLSKERFINEWTALAEALTLPSSPLL